MKIFFSAWCFLPLLALSVDIRESDQYTQDEVPCMATEDSLESLECQEARATQVELLQVQVKHTKSNSLALSQLHEESNDQEGHDPTNNNDAYKTGIIDLEVLGGDHRYLLCRPCARFAGDGMSGLPRHLVTGDCCGDSVCSSDRWENHETCPEDCKKVGTDESQIEDTQLLPPTESTLFGTLEGMQHDGYHCSAEDGKYISQCSHDRTESVWLESLLDRAKKGTLPFDLPPPGSVAVEFGCGKGQDSRNIASMAGYTLTAVDVSPSAIEEAKKLTPKDMLGSGSGQIEFVAYDSLALPVPQQTVDFFFDATVYCSLRHEYLARLYAVWSRLFTPGHTLVHLQCWAWEQDEEIVPRSQHDMEVDFEPFFEVLHSESCEKNQGGAGWCFYMKIKAAEAVERESNERLKIQQAVRDGNIEYVSQNLHDRSKAVSSAEIKTLYYIAMANSHVPLMKYLESLSPKKDDPFFSTVYGVAALTETVVAEDYFDSNYSNYAHHTLAHMRADWERVEAELILKLRLDRVVNSTAAH